MSMAIHNAPWMVRLRGCAARLVSSLAGGGTCHLIHFLRFNISRLSLSWLRLSRITDYLEVKLVPVFTLKSDNRYQNIVEKKRHCPSGAITPLFYNIFNISLTPGVKLHNKYYSVLKCGCLIYCFPQFCKCDMSRYGYLEVSRSTWYCRYSICQSIQSS